MPESILITCPDCKKQLKGPAELAGKKIRCKSCGYIFTVKGGPAAKSSRDPQPAKATAAHAAKTKPSPPVKTKAAEPVPPKRESPPPTHPEDKEGKIAYQLTDVVLGHRCPQCAAELESDDAIICLNCGYNTQTRTRTQTVMTIESTTPEWIRWLAPGVLCALVVLIAIGAICYVWIALRGMEGWWVFPTQVYGSVFAAFAGWLAGRFAFKRLIRNYHPPEKPLR